MHVSQTAKEKYCSGSRVGSVSLLSVAWYIRYCDCYAEVNIYYWTAGKLGLALVQKWASGLVITKNT